MIRNGVLGGTAVKRSMAAAVAMVACVGVAGGAGYDDFTRGLTQNLRGESEAAIKSFTIALAAPDLVAAYKPAAYRGRATAYLQLDRCQEALADLNSYETLKGRDTAVMVYRIWAELCLKDAAAAHKDLEEISKGNIGVADLWEFQRLEWRYDMFEESMKTGQEAFKGADKTSVMASYILLWQAMAAHRAGKLDTAEIAAGLAATKQSDWPRPLLDLYLGKQTPQGVQREATSWRQSKEDAQVCEANFYTAEWHLGRGEKDAAIPLLLAVTKRCPIDFIELPAAVSELKRQGVPVPKE
jgi:hypothetical protein